MRRPGYNRPACADEDVLELHHPSVDEIEGRVIGRDERIAPNDAVVALGKVQEGLADISGGLGAAHGDSPV